MRTLTPKDIQLVLEASLKRLKRLEAEINKLNVFPVPDGDTGTNMVLTMKSVVAEVAKQGHQHLDGLAQDIAYGSLTGARGNSGVILSQIIRGISEVVAAAKNDEIDALLLSRALENGVKISYQAIRKPVEGTMLTVIREAAASVRRIKKKHEVVDVLETALRAAREALIKTPDLLPVLKEAGVVDAGGYGLVALMEGGLAFLKGEPIEEVEMATFSLPQISAEEESLKYAYCTEFLLKGDSIDIHGFEKKLDPLGDSVMVVGSTGMTRIHVHTNSPGKILEMATGIGSISQVQINNMVEQTEERTRRLVEEQPPQKKIGLVSVATGEGIKDIMKSLGVDRLIAGGQTMNPSTQQILSAIEDVPTDTVIVLPNNSNIILTAEQAATLTEKKVSVLPTKTIPEAFSALLAFDEERALDENTKSMTKAISQVKSGEVTIAVRDSKTKKRKIKKGDYIGISEDEIKACGTDLTDVAIKLIRSMIDEQSERVMLLIGSDVSEKQSEKLIKAVEKKCHPCELESHRGGQALYHLIISVE